MTHQILQPTGWAKPIGHSNGMLARGRVLQVGGQIGWDENCTFHTDDFVEQVEKALRNIVAVLEAGGSRPEHIVQVTWFFTDRDASRTRMWEVGEVYCKVIGRHFPPMAAVQVVSLMEDRAKIEFVATAVLPD